MFILVTLTEDLVSVPSVHMAAQTISNSSSQESDAVFRVYIPPNMHVVYVHTYRQNT